MSEGRKKNISKALKGVKHSIERNETMSEKRKGTRLGDKNPNFGGGLFGEDNPMFGKHHSEKTLEKMRKPKTEEHKRKM